MFFKALFQPCCAHALYLLTVFEHIMESVMWHHKAIVIAKVLYLDSAWLGFTTLADYELNHSFGKVLSNQLDQELISYHYSPCCCCSCWRRPL